MPEGTITALRAQANDSQRVNVFVDGAFAIGVSLATLAKAGLYVGTPISAEEFARLEQVESGDKAFQAALARLAELGLVDDAAFARFWVENRQACRPRGAGALRDELRRKGIAPDV